MLDDLAVVAVPLLCILVIALWPDPPPLGYPDAEEAIVSGLRRAMWWTVAAGALALAIAYLVVALA
jgi:hypothetical protein